MQAFLFFNKVRKQVFVRGLAHAMKNAYICVKNTKQKYLKKYIFFSAAKIQALFRGYHARKVKVPIRRALGDKLSLI